MSHYVKNFFLSEDGVEIIEFIGLVIVAAVLIGVVASIGARMQSSSSTAKTQMNNALNAIDGIK